jgi:phenylalanyl-tRNA synthetase beta chain
LKIPVSWLRDFVDVPGPPDDIARTMSLRGFAVEGIENAGDDAVIDFEVMANRPDCLCVAGIAREVAAAYNLPLREPGTGDLRLADLTSIERGDVDVVIENAALCPRYVGAAADVAIEPSPAWLQRRLQAAGVRPICNIVDVTNYVMLELGQPMHAFDLMRIRGGQIRVRAARPGERLRTLDGELRELTADTLVIADANEPIAIGGVMGGADSEVADSTTSIVFEAAHFSALSVRRTSKRLGLKTEASIRFERGADPNLPAVAMARACALLEVTGSGHARGPVVDRYPSPRASIVIWLRRQKIAGLLGAPVQDRDVQRILERLGFGVAARADGWNVTIPTRRVDVQREVDLIEEIARHHGFDRLPATFPELDAPAPAPDPRIMRARQLRTALTTAGFSEAVTFGFVAQAAAAPFAEIADIVPIANPLSETFAVLRPSVVPGLVAAAAHNRRREQRDVRLFELGTRFSRRGEHRMLACAWTGAAAPEHWSRPARDVDFFDMKAVVERVCEAMRVSVRTEADRLSWLVPGRSATILHNGTSLGVLGQLAPTLAEAYGLPASDPIYVAEIDLDAAEAAAARGDAAVEPLPRHPSVTRDLSVLIDDTLAAETVRATVHSAGPSTLVRVREFDRYQGKGVPNGKVSLSLRLTFRSPDRTLTDTEVQAAMDAIIGALKERHGAVQR